MKPHSSYYKAIKQIHSNPAVHGMAHITGGGMEANLSRIIPEGLQAKIDLAKWKPLPLFQFLKEIGSIEEARISSFFDCYEIGIIQHGNPKVSFYNHIDW